MYKNHNGQVTHKYFNTERSQITKDNENCE